MTKSKKKKSIPVKATVGRDISFTPGPSLQPESNLAMEATLRRMVIILMIVAGLVFINTVFNEYSGDDFYITDGSEQAMKGIKGIPEILTSHFVTFKGMGGSFRATGRVSFAIEYQFFGFNPHVGHFFNVVFYVLLIWVLFRFLIEVFGRQYSLLIFLAVLLYAVHPLRTEVVASLKSRDELFSALFSLLACTSFVRYFKYSHWKYLAASSLLFLLALMSKESSQQFLAVAPLAAYFSGEKNWKKMLAATGVLFFTSIVFWLYMAFALPNTQLLWMSEVKEGYPFIEHQLIYTDDPNIKYGTAFYGLLFYLKLVLYPFAVSCFYGYDIIPQVGFDDPRVILSVLIYASAGVIALVLFRKRHILSFAILFSLITLSMFSNLVIQVAGVVADRFIFAASIGFSIIIAWAILKLTRVSFSASLKQASDNKVLLVLITALVLVLSAKSIHRNTEWKNSLTLAAADANRNPRSAMTHLYYSIKLREELEKPGADSAAIVPLIVKHFKQVLEIYEPYPYPHYMLAIYYGDYYRDYPTAIRYAERAIELLPGNRNYINLLSDFYDATNNLQAKSRLMQHMMEYIPDAFEPYYFFGVQSFFSNEHSQAISYFESALKLGARDPEMLRFMRNYYQFHNLSSKIDTLNYYENL